LAGVFFDGGKDATSGEGQSQPVDPAAGGAGVLEMVAEVEGKQFGLADADSGIAFQQIDKGFDEARGDLDIRVDDEEIVGVDLVEAKIIAAGEAFVIGHRQGMDHRKAGAEHFKGTIIRVIVDYVYFFIFI